MDPDTGEESWRAFGWIDQRLVDLGAFAPPGNSTAQAINDAGLILVGSDADDFLWYEGVSVVVRDLVPEDLSIEPCALNNGGQLLVNATSPDFGGFATLVMTPLYPALGDLDSDCLLGSADLIALLGDWGRCRGECPADLNADCVVGAADLIILLGNWG